MPAPFSSPRPDCCAAAAVAPALPWCRHLHLPHTVREQRHSAGLLRYRGRAQSKKCSTGSCLEAAPRCPAICLEAAQHCPASCLAGQCAASCGGPAGCASCRRPGPPSCQPSLNHGAFSDDDSPRVAEVLLSFTTIDQLAARSCQSGLPGLPAPSLQVASVASEQLAVTPQAWRSAESVSSNDCANVRDVW
jgi:hypothetical protein